MPRYQPGNAARPGRVARILGVIFQSDGKSTIGRLFIRPLEAVDRAVAGLPTADPGSAPLAMHAGLHVALDDGREFVAEQLVGTLYMDLQNGLNWTPIEQFRQRDRGGWDVTVPMRTFRGVDDGAVAAAVSRLNAIEGHPFVGEDCTAFVERAFGERRLFADSPLLQRLGIGVRVGDPALPLLDPKAEIEEPARSLLRADTLKRLPDPLADAESPNARLWARRLGVAALVGALGGLLAGSPAIRRDRWGALARRLMAATRPARAGRARLPSPRAGS